MSKSSFRRRRKLLLLMLLQSFLMSLRAGPKPLINMWPGKLKRAAARHHADMAPLHLRQKLILAADPRHDALRLAWRRDMIVKGDHIEQVSADMAQVHPLAANDQIPFHKPVLLVELLNELPVGRPGHGDEIGYPGIHGVPR